MLNLQSKRGRIQLRVLYLPRIEGSDFRLIPPEEVAATALESNGQAQNIFITDSVFNGNYGLAASRPRIRETGPLDPWGAFFAPHAPSRRVLRGAARRRADARRVRDRGAVRPDARGPQETVQCPRRVRCARGPAARPFISRITSCSAVRARTGTRWSRR